MNPVAWDGLSEEQRDEVMNGHRAFMDTVVFSSAAE
jgi:hypothetical protein